jgi:hypothetical protein
MKLRPEQHRLDWWRRGRDRWSRLEDLEDADRVNKKGGKNAPMPAPIGDGFFRLRTFACVVMQKGPDQLQENAMYFVSAWRIRAIHAEKIVSTDHVRLGKKGPPSRTH